GSTIYGIYSFYSDSPVGTESVISNNLIYNLNNTGVTYTIYNFSSDGTHYRYNTVAINNAGMTRGFFQASTATNIVFTNNIISLKGGPSGAKYAITFASGSTVTSNNNVFH